MKIVNQKKEDHGRGTMISNRVAMVLNSDFSQDTQGGIETYAKELALALERKGVNIWRIGIFASEREKTHQEIIIARSRISNYLFLLLLLKAAFLMRKRGDWIIHVHRPDQLVPLRIATGRRGRIFVCSIHGPARKAVTENKGRLIGFAYSILEIIGLKIANVVLFVDRRTFMSYANIFPWLKAKSHILPAGISRDFYEGKIQKRDALIKFGFRNDEKIICFVGRLEHEKNVHLILRAFARIAVENQRVKLVIAGDGSLRKDLEHLAQELGLPNRVVFFGRLSHEGVRDLLCASEILVLASKWEGSPLIIREALAVGTRVVSTNVGDISELIHDESLGNIIPVTTEDALAEGLLKILGQSGKEISADYMREFSWDKIAERIIAMYEEFILQRN